MREKERKLLLFAGTTEGRMLAEHLSKKRIACYVSTATEYGKSLLQEEQLSDIIILAGRMNEEEIKTFLTEKKIDCVVDATHPFAKIVTENIVNACKETQTSQNPFLKEERKRKMREKERKLLLFAGTTEGRMLAEHLSKKRIACYVSTATEYGKSLLQEEQLSDIIILAGRMNEEEIKTFLTEKKIDCVVDATHPFAKIVTENIVNACKETQTGYIRCLREMETSSEDLAGQEQVRVFESVREAAEFLSTTEGKILITTGSKELKEYTKIGNYQERCFARVLSTKAAMEESVRLGFEGKHLIAMQGPFSEEMNLALLHQTRARYFVTKESGKAGGFEEKLKAAKKAGAVLIVIGRPQERGRSVQEVCHFIESNFGKKEQE